MKTRLFFALWACLLTVFLIVGLLPSPPVHPAALADTPTPTPTPSPAPTDTRPPFVPFPTHFPLSASLTPIPQEATYTSLAPETPDVVASSTLLPIPTATLIFFATVTATPYGGTATPPVPLAYALDGKPTACYKGPSPAYIQMDVFKITQIVGRDASGKWWFLMINKGRGVYVPCWVSVDRVATGGNLAGLSVAEPGLPQITQVKVTFPGQPAAGVPYVQTIACDAGLTNTTTLHFIGQIFTDGPLEDVGYLWTTDAPAQFQPGRAPVKAWDAPAEIAVNVSVPSQAGTYTLSLRTTFPMEVLGELRFTLKCK